MEVARAVAVQPDGKILIAGPFEKSPKAAGTAAKDTDIAVLRFDATGKPDPTFGKNGTANIDFGTGKPIDAEATWPTTRGAWRSPTGRIVVFGSSPAPDREDADFVHRRAHRRRRPRRRVRDEGRDPGGQQQGQRQPPEHGGRSPTASSSSPATAATPPTS